MKIQIYNQRFNEGLGFKTIARNLKISKNTVKKYVTAFEKNLEYYNTLSNKEYDAAFVDLFKKDKMNTATRSSKLITPTIDKFIKECLDSNNAKIENGKRKQIMKKIDIYEIAIEKHGYVGSPSTLNSYVRVLEDKAKEAFIKRQFEPGEICEFDWGNVSLHINGVNINFKLAVFYLPISKIRVSYLYESENMEAFVDSHIKFINEIGHIPATFVYDNMRVAVATFVGKKEKIPTKTLVEMSTFYGFSFRFCNAYKGNEKGGVERSVEFVRRKSFCYYDTFESLKLAKLQLKQKLDTINEKNLDNFKKEKKHMTKKRYDFVYGEVEAYTVDKYSTISVKRNKYSVPDKLVGKVIKVKVTVDYVHIYHDEKLIYSHERLIDNGKWKLDILHYKSTFIKKPGGIKDSMAFKSMYLDYEQLYTNHFIDQEVEFIKTLVIIDKYSYDKVLQVIKDLLKCSSLVSSDAINLMLSNESNVLPLYSKDNEVELAANETINKYAGIL